MLDKKLQTIIITQCDSTDIECRPCAILNTLFSYSCITFQPLPWSSPNQHHTQNVRYLIIKTIRARMCLRCVASPGTSRPSSRTPEGWSRPGRGGGSTRPSISCAKCILVNCPLAKVCQACDCTLALPGTAGFNRQARN